MATQRRVYHVSPFQNHWKVKAENASRATARHEKKSDAIADARERAKKGSLGQVIIHKGDGSIEKEYTYGKDPRDIPG